MVNREQSTNRKKRDRVNLNASKNNKLKQETKSLSLR